MVRLSELSEGLPRDAETEAELLVEEDVLDRTLVMIGSHDMSVDVLADLLKRDPRGFRLTSANVGSLGGLLALRSGCAHAAGSHLLEEETGEYNRSYVKKYIPDMSVSLFHLVRREQGLIIRKGNPRNIRGLEDLAGDDVTFINRQPGSGTRILLDFRLKELGMDSAAIRGYDREEYTHMAVAVDVKSGVSDVGLGIFAAARALDLEFIPVVSEQYDLVIPSAFLEDERIKMLLDTAATEAFRERMISLGGYDPAMSGAFWTEIGP
jgi:putative molybdopterin biosynthesis protein